MPGAFSYGMTPTNSPKGSAFQAVQPSVIPVGVIEMFAGSTAPNGWLVCDGSNVSRKTYSNLFKIIGTTYGAGNSNDTFTLPDCRGRAPIGVGTGTYATATTRTLGSSAGAETVSLAAANIPSLTTGNESANHQHTGTTDGQSASHYHQNYSDGINSGTMGRASLGFGGGTGGGYAGFLMVGAGANNVSTSYTGYQQGDHQHTFTSAVQNANHTHTYTNNSLSPTTIVQPSIVFNFIIKT